jgi:cation:H+ antiporter
LVLEPSNRVEIGFLMIAGIAVFAIPATGRIHIAFGLALLGWFGYYLYKLTRGDVEEPELVGTAAALGALPDRTRRIAVAGLFVFAAAVIVTCAKPFADNLIGAGTQLGIDRFLLVQWLAPLASEAPEFIIATIFAARGKGDDAIATLISAKVNQWTLLIGSLPVAYMLGGGGTAMHLDGRQIEEIVLTAAQTLMGVTLLLGLRFQRWAAWALLGLFVVQFPLTSTEGRLALSGVYAVIAALALIRYRREVLPTAGPSGTADTRTRSPNSCIRSSQRADHALLTAVNFSGGTVCACRFASTPPVRGVPISRPSSFTRPAR